MHPDDVKPNHHWCTHIFDQIIGPVYSFWSFLFERLNKVLKSYQTNNHEDGEVEVTFFRAFSRDVRLRDLVSSFFPNLIVDNVPPEYGLAGHFGNFGR